ncbi:hypothetical protein ABT279_50030, partial [Amycolatopsis sp. NPDC000673]
VPPPGCAYSVAVSKEDCPNRIRSPGPTYRTAGPDAGDTVARLRDHLSDDLNTPQALTAIDAWVTSALRRDGTDQAAPGLIKEAVDALLGIVL